MHRTKIIDASVGAFLGMLTLSMLHYPGGTWWDPHGSGHSFWGNFICDLLRPSAIGGQPNVVGSRLGLVAVLALVVGVVTAFSLSREIIPSRRRLSRPVAWFGALTSLGLALPALYPNSVLPHYHALTIVVTGVPMLAAFATLVGAILLEPVATRLLRLVSLLLLVLSALSMALYGWTAFFHGPALRSLPTIERVANMTLLVWLLLVARFVRQRLFAAYIARARYARTLASKS